MNTFDSITFNIFEKNVTISRERVYYNNTRKRFIELAYACADSFKELYNQNKSIQDVIAHSPNQAIQAISPAIDECINTMISNNVYTVDRNTFYEKYILPREKWSNAYQEISDKYAEIVLDKEQQAAYRKSCRENRDRWVGGGFGVEGAIRGAVTAGAMNMVAGAGYAFLNGICGIISSVATDSKLNKLFNDEKTLTILTNGVFNTVYQMHFGLAKCLKDEANNHHMQLGLVSNEDSNKSLAIINNVDLAIEEDKKKKMLIDAFMLNPYQEKWYTLVFELYGDSDGKLQKLEDYFSVSVVKRTKENQLINLYNSFTFNSESEAIVAKNKLYELKKKLGYSGSCKVFELIENIITDFDVKARTVGEMIFPTRDIAEFNRKEYENYKNDLDKVNRDSIKQLSQLNEKLQTYSGELANKHKSIIENQIQNIQESLRTIQVPFKNESNIICQTEEEAEVSKDYLDALSKLYQNRPQDPYKKNAYCLAFIKAIENDKRSQSIPLISNLFCTILKKEINENIEKNEPSYTSLIESEYGKLDEEVKKKIHLKEQQKSTSIVIRNAYNYYLQKLGFMQNENILLVYDGGIFTPGKSGFTITDRGFYSTGSSFNNGPFFLSKEQLSSSTTIIDNSNLVINEKHSDICLVEEKNRNIVCNIVKHYINMLQKNIYFDYKISIPKTLNAEEIVQLKVNLRKHGKYKDYYARFAKPIYAEEELEDSISSGYIYNYHEIGVYLDTIIKNFSVDELEHISSQQSKKFDKFTLLDNAEKEYMQENGYTGNEYPILVYTECIDKPLGISLTSRGLYGNTKESNDCIKWFIPLHKLTNVVLSDDKLHLIIEDKKIDLSPISENNRQDFVKLISLVLEKTIEVNKFYIDVLNEKRQAEELSETEFIVKQNALYIEKKKEKGTLQIRVKKGNWFSFSLADGGCYSFEIDNRVFNVVLIHGETLHSEQISVGTHGYTLHVYSSHKNLNKPLFSCFGTLTICQNKTTTLNMSRALVKSELKIETTMT